MFVSFFFLDVRLETDERSRGKMQNTEASLTKWIRKDFDADGYFLLEGVWERGYRTAKFLTADNVSSLTLQGKCTISKVLLKNSGYKISPNNSVKDAKFQKK